MPEDKTLSVNNAEVLLFSVVNVVIFGVFSKIATVVKMFCAGRNDRDNCGILLHSWSACSANLDTTLYRLDNYMIPT